MLFPLELAGLNTSDIIGFLLLLAELFLLAGNSDLLLTLMIVPSVLLLDDSLGLLFVLDLPSLVRSKRLKACPEMMEEDVFFWNASLLLFLPNCRRASTRDPGCAPSLGLRRSSFFFSTRNKVS